MMSYQEFSQVVSSGESSTLTGPIISFLSVRSSGHVLLF